MHLKDEDGGKSCPEDLKHWILVGRGQHRRLKSPFLIKKDDPGVPSIECAINGYSFQKTLYDTGSDDNIMAAVTYQLLHGTMPLQPIYSAPDDFQVIDMGEDEYDPPTILGRPFLNTIKAIIYIGTGEVHMYFPSEKVRNYFTDHNYIVEDSKQVRTRRRRNRNQRRQIIKNGWVDYEGEVIRTEDIQLEQNCPEETVAPNQVWREKIVIHEERRRRNHRLRHLANLRTTEKTESPVRRT
jgi:hypothetical protein